MEDSVVARFGRYLAGEMNTTEKGVFEQALEADQQLKAEFMAYKLIWQHSAPDTAPYWDTEAAWARFEGSSRREAAPRTRRLALYWSVAASLLVLIAAAYFLFLKPSPETYLYAADSDNIIELKDGSRVHLNRGSAITVSPFSGITRHVTLSGEAYFEVAPDTKKPFLIKCGKTVTEVIGTAFNLRQSKDEVILSVQSGKVIFRTADPKEEALALTSGEAAVFEHEQLRMLPNPSPNYNAWHTRQLWFKGMSLSEVAKEVSTYFNQPVIIENPAVKNCTPGSSLPYKNPEIKSLLNGIATAINAKVVQEGNTYVIKGGSCN